MPLMPIAAPARSPSAEIDEPPDDGPDDERNDDRDDPIDAADAGDGSHVGDSPGDRGWSSPECARHDDA
jgi:hypothetical protein